jgi:hypothetical protein
MADGYSRAKYIDDLVSSGEFNYEEAKKYADEYERGAPTKVEKPESAAISEPSPADVQAGLKEMKTEREKQEGMTFAEKAALGAGGVAAGGAATYLLTRRPSIKDRMIGDTARIEPQMDVNQQGPKEPTFAPEKPTALTKAASVAEQFQSEYGIPLSEVEQHYQVPIKDMQEARLLGGAYKANMAPATPAGVIPSTTNMTTSAPIGVAPPAAMPQPAISAAPAPAVSAPTAPVPVIEVPVVAATEADVPPEQKAKTSTKPVAPPSVEKLTKEQKSMKNYLVAQYGGGVEGEAAYGKVKEILGSTPEFPKGQGGGLTAEQNKVIKDWRKANIEGPKVNLTKDMKKAFKGGGGLAVLAAIPGFAEAAQNKDFGKMTDIATDFLVLPFAESRQLNEGEEQELAKRRYEGMVGSGRGIAPPSMYRR